MFNFSRDFGALANCLVLIATFEVPLDSNQSLLPGCSHLRWRGTKSEGRGGSGAGRASSDSAEPDRTKLKLGKHPGQGPEELNNDVVQDRIFPRLCGT